MLIGTFLTKARFAITAAYHDLLAWLPERPSRVQTPRILELMELEQRVMLSAVPLAAIEVYPMHSAGLDAIAHVQYLASDVEAQPANAQQVLEKGDNQQQAGAGVKEALAAEVSRRELVFIDPAATNYEQLVNDLMTGRQNGRQTEVVVLDSSRDGVEQISEVMAAYRELDAVHIVSHGTDGAVKLGNMWLSLDNVSGYADRFVGWRHALATEADVLFYGCELAAKDAGQLLVASLSMLTGADVAASVDGTGDAQLGGDWDLEFATGDIETSIVFGQDVQQTWSSLLAVITVNTTADLNDGNTSSIANLIAAPGTDGFISLREAIIAANNTPGTDTIFLPAGTFTLSIAGIGEDAAATGDLDVTDPLTINGADAKTTIIDGGAIDRVIDVKSTLSISGVTVTNGNTGATGGGIRADGNVDVTLTDVAVIGNTAVKGGGLRGSASSSITLARVTVSGNTAVSDGGAISVVGGASTLDMTNVTISGNTAGGNGGGLSTNSTVTFTNSTIAFNTAGGGIFVFGGGDVILKNTILDSNTGGNSNATLTSLGNNIDSGNTAGLTGPGDQINTDPLLGPLQDNGGPTPTHALLAGSPAIDAGTNAGAPTIDQRGFVRDVTADVGAFEFGALGNANPMITSSGLPSVAENSTGVLTVTATDPDLPAQPLTFSITGGADAGRFTLNNTTGALTFNTTPNFENPTDANTDNVYELQVTADDGNGGTDVQLISMTVTDANDRPVATSDEFSVGRTETLTVVASGVLANDVDEDGNPLVAILVDGPSNGDVVLGPDGSLLYVADRNFVGTDSFTYRSSDGAATSNLATVTITVNQVVAPPPPPSVDPGPDASPADGDTSDADDDSSNETDNESEINSADGLPGIAASAKSKSFVADYQTKEVQTLVTSLNRTREETFALYQVDTDSDDAISGRRRRFDISHHRPTHAVNVTPLYGAVADLATTILWDKLDSFQDDVSQIIASDQQSKALIVATIATISTGLTVGYVVWLLRGGTLMASIIPALSAWTAFDPLPILDRFQNKDENKDESEDRQEEESTDSPHSLKE